MKLQEFYNEVNGNYDEMMSRIPREASIIKFLRKFVDNHDFNDMMEAVEACDYEKVFTASHTLKGVCANLSLTELANRSSEVCECVRGGEPKGDVVALAAQTKESYDRTIQAIGELED